MTILNVINIQLHNFFVKRKKLLLLLLWLAIYDTIGRHKCQVKIIIQHKSMITCLCYAIKVSEWNLLISTHYTYHSVHLIEFIYNID